MNIRSQRGFVFLVAGLVSLAGCDVAEPATSCDGDEDCPVGTCVDGFCQSPEDSGTATGDGSIGADGSTGVDAGPPPNPDRDGDGVNNGSDNCPDAANADQADRDGDFVGDACDNCTDTANADQADENLNGTGDVCETFIDPDADSDGDGAPDGTDNCFTVANPGQEDSDGDGKGDACDNCPGIANYAQTDTNLDGVGDACSVDIGSDGDGDGYPDAVDNCDMVANPGQEDGDGDSVGDACDNCVDVANFDQADSDMDGQGDACPDNPYDPTRDTDGDGEPDVTDNCPGLSNPGQADTDVDSIGNACDNCPTVANFFQEDLDGNMVGDACELPPDTTPTCSDDTTMSTRVTPNLYFVIDRSGSMDNACDGCTGNRYEELQAALDAMSTTLTADFNVGVGLFPVAGSSCGVGAGFERLDLQPGHSAATFRASYVTTQQGNTPAQQALDTVRTNMLYNFAGDTIPTRPKAVVFITDGAPNCSGSVSSVATAAGNLFAAGVPVYVLGYTNLNANDMDDIAEAGRGLPSTGADDWFPISNRASIEAALQSIAEDLISCTVGITLTGDEDPSRMIVESDIDGTITRIPASDFAYDSAADTVTLLGASCTTLEDAARAGSVATIRVRIACASMCTPSMEVCDYIDNNCDGTIDEGCTMCPDELCDGIDNDCDGMVDEGCPPACIPVLEVCNGVDDDCDGEVDEGCTAGCTPSFEVCDGVDNDCDGMVDEGCPVGPG